VNPNAGNASQLSFFQDKDQATWQKNKNIQAVLVALSEDSATKSKAMKRYGFLYDQICTAENLRCAYNKAKLGKANNYSVRLFDKNLDENLRLLLNELTECVYKTSEYSHFTIYEPKERLISRLPFRDRITHHAIMNILEPLWTPIYIENTYSCIKGRGINRAHNRLKNDLKDIEGTRFCLKMDIRKFYPSVNHDILKIIIRRSIKDPKVLQLLDGIIDSALGVPIGNYLSQFFANLYLSYFDHWLKEVKNVTYYHRYCDDIVVLHSDKNVLHSLCDDIIDYLRNNLDLEIKRNHQVFPVSSRGIDFVGFVFYHTHIKMRKSIKKNMCRKAAKINGRGLTPKEYKKRIAPWLGWAKYSNSKHLLKTVLEYEKIF
jgi:RNA-directed DNA polymerase